MHKPAYRALGRHHNLGVVPKLQSRAQPAGGTMSTEFNYDALSNTYEATDVHVDTIYYSKSYLFYPARQHRHKLTKLICGFQPARRTHTTIAQFAERFLYEQSPPLPGTEPVYLPMTTPVTVDNTQVQTVWVCLYLHNADNLVGWMTSGSSNPHPNTTFNKVFQAIEDYSQWMPLERSLKAFDGTFFQPVDHAQAGRVQFSLRRGPLGVASPPYLNPYNPALWPAGPLFTPPNLQDTMLLLRTSPNVHQTWPAMASGFDAGIFMTGYYWRCGGDWPWLYSPWNVPVDGSGTAYTQKYVRGDMRFESPMFEFPIRAGTTEIEVDIDIPAGLCLYIVPSIQPARICNLPPTETASKSTPEDYLDAADPGLRATSSVNIMNFLPGVLPSDSTLAMCPPVNARQKPEFSNRAGTWLMNEGDVPVVETGFTLSLCERPFNDGAEFLWYLQVLKGSTGVTLPPNFSANFSNGPAEILPPACVPFFNCSVITEDA